MKQNDNRLNNATTVVVVKCTEKTFANCCKLLQLKMWWHK